MSINVAIGAKFQRINQQIFLPVKIGGRCYDVLLVIPKLNTNIILGCEWLEKVGAVVDSTANNIYIKSAGVSIPSKWEAKEKRIFVNALGEKRHCYSEN